MKSWNAMCVAALCVVFSHSSYAELPCNQLIVDEQGYIKNSALVTDQVESLGSKGAEVRVRVIKSFAGSANLDTYVTDMRKSVCPSWQQSDGDLRSNFVVMYVATQDRQVGLYMGGQWERELKKEWPAILGTMKPKLGSGLKNEDLSLALATGLKEISETIQAASQPKSFVQPVVIQSEPTDYSGLWKVLGYVFGGGFVSLIVVFLNKVHVTRRKHKQEQKGAQQKAQIARGQCTSLLHYLNDNLPVLEARVKTVGVGFDEKTSAEWNSRFAGITSATRRHSEANASVRSNPNDDNLEVGEYDAMHFLYSELKSSLELVRQDIEVLTQDIEASQQLQESIARIRTESAEVLASAEEVIAAIKEKGFLVENSDKMLAEARRIFEEAEIPLKAKNFQGASKLFQRAIKEAKQSQKMAEELPSIKQSLEEGIHKGGKKLVSVKAEIESGRQVFLEIERDFASVGTESLIGNGTEAGKHLSDAQSRLDAVGDLFAKQSWTEAKKLLTEAENHLNESSSLIRSIVERRKHLQIARDESPGEIQAALADIKKAHEYVTSNDADTDDIHFDTLQKATDITKEAQELLQSNRPDYLRIVRLASSANLMADKVLMKAQSEAERAESKRRQAHSLLREASSSVSAAKEFMEDHRSDVGSEAKRLLASAVQELGMAERQKREDVDAVIRLAGNADKNADNALATAKRNFSQAEDEREAKRARDRRSQSSGTSTTNWSSPRSTGWGNPSSSFGGSSSIGGGGSSFGGSSGF